MKMLSQLKRVAISLRFVLPMTSVCLMVSVVAGQEESSGWGDLVGKIVYQGPAPKTRRLPQHEPFVEDEMTVTDESLLIDPEGHGLKNVVVFLEADGKEIRVHPDYASAADKALTLVLEKGRIEPRILLMRTSQTLRYDNRDKEGHSLGFELLNNTPP